MERLLITGATGFIGRNILPLLQKKYEVIATSSRSTEIPGFSGEVIACDLLDAKQVKQTVGQLKPSKLVHLAWGMEPGNYNLSTNFDWLSSSIHLLENFQKNGGEAVLMAGSCVQYDWSSCVCTENSTPRADNSTYGTCKNILQDFALSFSEAHSIQCLWALPFFMYGPYEDEKRLVAYLVKNILENKEATVQNGAIFRDFMHVEDVSNLMFELFESKAHGDFNIGTGEMVNLGDIAKEIGEILGRQQLVKINIPEVVTNKYVVANTDKVANQIKWQPKHNLNSGLENTIKWWENYVETQ